jgi:hypothetical protein
MTLGHWRKVPGSSTVEGRDVKGGRWELTGTAFVVLHCGHPTALWPYYGLKPDGRMILAPNGRGFRFLKDALSATAAVARTGAAS